MKEAQNRLRVFLLGGLLALVFVMGIQTVFAQDCPTGTEPSAGVCVPTETGLSEQSVSDIVVGFLLWILYIFGFLAITAFVVSGLMYLTSAGNEGQVTKAKSYMLYSIVGVIVGLAGLVILYAVQAFLLGSPRI